MKRNRVNTLIEVEFEYKGNKKQTSVWVPFPIFVEAIRKTFDAGLVGLDGTDNAIWNKFVDLEMIDKFEDNEDFMNYCKELYKGSSFEEEDYEEWLSDKKSDDEEE